MSKTLVDDKSESVSSHIIVIHNAVIVTMNPQLDVFRHGGLAVEGDIIKAIGQSDDVLSHFSHLPSVQFVDLHGHFLLPGLYSHLIAYMSYKLIIICLNIFVSEN